MRLLAIAALSLLAAACDQADTNRANNETRETAAEVSATAKDAGGEIKEAVSSVTSDPDVQAAASSAKEAAKTAGTELKEAAQAVGAEVKSDIHQATAPEPGQPVEPGR